MLFQAKGTVERGAIRMASGQLADYKWHIKGGPSVVAVLLPSKTARGTSALLHAEGIEAV